MFGVGISRRMSHLDDKGAFESGFEGNDLLLSLMAIKSFRGENVLMENKVNCGKQQFEWWENCEKE